MPVNGNPDPLSAAPQPRPPAGKPISTETFVSSLRPQSGYSASSCHLNITGMEQVRVECLLEVKCTQMTAEHFLVYVAVPPLTSFQGEGKVTIALPSPSTKPPLCKLLMDNQGREVLQILVPVDQHPHLSKHLLLVASFEASLFTRELFFDPNVQMPYQVASTMELDVAMANNGPYLLTDSDFQIGRAHV